MVITSIRIFPYTKYPKCPLKATATVILNNAVILQSIRIRTCEHGRSRLEITYPVREIHSGGSRLCFIPSTNEFQEYFDESILNAYAGCIAGSGRKPYDATIGFDKVDRFEVTRASVYPFANPKGMCKARVNLEIDGDMWLRGMTLVVYEDSTIWLGMPRRLLQDGTKMMDIFHPISRESRIMLTEKARPYCEKAMGADYIVASKNERR